MLEAGADDSDVGPCTQGVEHEPNRLRPNDGVGIQQEERLRRLGPSHCVAQDRVVTAGETAIRFDGFEPDPILPAFLADGLGEPVGCTRARSVFANSDFCAGDRADLRLEGAEAIDGQLDSTVADDDDQYRYGFASWRK
jgi:hypothetical protein